MVTIKYALSPAGQKADLLAGGKGDSTPTITLKHGDPEYAEAVALAEVDSSGAAKLELHYGGYKRWDSAPSASQLVANAAEVAAAKKAKAEQEREDLIATAREEGIEYFCFKHHRYGWEVNDAREAKTNWPEDVQQNIAAARVVCKDRNIEEGKAEVAAAKYHGHRQVAHQHRPDNVDWP